MTTALASMVLILLGEPTTFAEKVVASARDQLSWGTTYDPAYVRLKYPGGDVPKSRGVCTDVVIRAFRAGGLDLQKTVHEDMKASFRAYPQRYGLKKPDPNIDHRRVPNLATFFRRKGAAVRLPADPRKSVWKAGYVVVWVLPNGRDHVGVVTDVKGASGYPTVIHNLSRPAEEDCLFEFKVVGQWRWK